MKEAFGATELIRTTGSAGGIYAEVRIGDSVVMIGGGGAWSGEVMPGRSTCTWTMLTQYISVRFRQALPRSRSRRTSPMGIAWGRKGRVRQYVVYCHAHKGCTLVEVAANAPAHVRL
ncbi:MAG: hypothetical protein ACJ8DI_03580 [Ktedonobacteraceae bacterium]